MNQFDLVKAAAADPILGITEAFRADPNPAKVNLGVGVYQDATGASPVLPSVRTAAEALLGESSKSYLPISGHPEFLVLGRELVFGTNNEMVQTGRIASVQTPGGTGGLRLCAEFIRRCLGQRTVWLSSPTWDNHQGIFQAADLPIQHYPYYDPVIKGHNLSGMLTVLETIPENDVVLLHACCHNPTGVDPSGEDWETIAKICKARNLMPILDFAYQGFSSGLVSDAVAVRAMAEYGLEFFVCSSFSKNFGLYRERVGALHVVAKNRPEADAVLSQLKALIRTIYSNPPAHGAALVARILADNELRLQWEQELGSMRDRIRAMRAALVDGLAAAGAPGDFSFIKSQRGMFSFSGLQPKTVERLRQQHAIYMVGNGRINVAGLNPDNIATVCKAVAACLQS
jgi:aspartate/tyrosine/aromatic aminotransferase